MGTLYGILADYKGKVYCAFIMGKTRTAPLKQWPVPRLELQAVVIAVRLHVPIGEEIGLLFNGVTSWADSFIASQYIKTRSTKLNHPSNGDTCQLPST